MKVLTLSKRLTISLPDAEDFIKAVLVFLISRASVLGTYPFGLAFAFLIMRKKSIYLGIFAMLLGIMSAGGEVLKYILSTAFFLIYTHLKKDKDQDVIFCSLSLTLSGALTILITSQSPLYMGVCLVEGILSILMWIITKRAKDFYLSYKGITRASQEELIAIVLLCGIILSGFSGIYITHNLHISTVLGLYLILSISRFLSVGLLGGIGIVLGFVSSINSYNTVLIAGIFGIGAMIAGLLKDFKKIGAVLGLLIGEMICILYVGEFKNPAISFYETLVAIILFVSTPKVVIARIEGFLLKAIKNPPSEKEGKLKEYLVRELKNISSAFTNLAESFFSLSHERENPLQASDLFDEVAERVCKKCSRWGECWIQGFGDMYRDMYDILGIIEENGSCDVLHLPTTFKEKCQRPKEFLTEYSHLYEIYKQEAIYRGEALFGQDLVAKQYHEISNLMNDLSEDVETGFSFVESAEIKIDAALEKSGIFAHEINVIENIRKEPEVYIKAGINAEPRILEDIVSDVIGMPMRIEEDSASMKFVAKNRYSMEYAVCQYSPDASGISGDAVLQFETKDNKFCVLLCDGMGAGEKAHEESQLTATLLEDFIKAGFIKNTAIKMINSTLAMKIGSESFSTIDLTEVNLRTGDAEFLKVGASETYIRDEKEVKVIRKKAYPVGILEEVEAPSERRKLKEGDVVVMISDGVSDTGYGTMRGDWIAKVISNNEANMQTLAKDVLENARKKAYPKPCDDMTVIAMRLKKAQE